MLAEVDPEAAPAERLRALGDGRWELKAVIDAECQRGLQQLRELLSHVDPHLTVGQLVGWLVQEGLERYDPSRPPRRKRRASDPAGEERSSGTAARETADRVAAAAESQDRAGKSTAPTVSRSAPKRPAKQTPAGSSPAALPAGGDPGETSPKRRLAPRPGSRTSAPKLVAPRADRAGSGGDAVATELTAAAKARVPAGSSISVPSSDGAGSAERDCGGEASHGNRRRGTAGANFGGEARQIDSGWGQARSLAARPGLLQLRRPAYREALRFTLLSGGGPHRPGRSGRRSGAGESPPPLRGSSPLPTRSPAALGSATLGEVSAGAAPERAPRSRSIRRIAATRDTSPGWPSRRRRVPTTILTSRPRWWRYALWPHLWPHRGQTVRVCTLRVAMRRCHLLQGSMISCRFRRSHPKARRC